MNTTNKKTYLVPKDEFNRKVLKLPISVCYVSKYNVAMVAKVSDFVYIGLNFYIDGEYIEFLVENRADFIDYVESNFKGRWAE